MAVKLVNSNNFSVFSIKYLQKQPASLEEPSTIFSYRWWCTFLTNLHSTQDHIFCEEFLLAMIEPIPDFLAAPVLYIQVPILTGSVRTDKQHVHKLYSSMKLLTHKCNIKLLPSMTFSKALWYFLHYPIWQFILNYCLSYTSLFLAITCCIPSM